MFWHSLEHLLQLPHCSKRILHLIGVFFSFFLQSYFFSSLHFLIIINFPPFLAPSSSSSSSSSFKACFGLEAKNPAIILKDADLDLAVSEVVLGGLSFNGQRCTAIKLVFVDRSVAELFAEKLAVKVDQLKLSSPWDPEAKITPLAEPGKPEFLAGMVADALSKGARLMTRRGNTFRDTAYRPAGGFPVTP